MKYDVIIIGGGTAGCACAYTLGKLNIKTLIIEKNSFLGGTMTSALVTPAMKTISKYNTEFFNILMNKLNSIRGQITYSDGNSGWFNPELMKITLDDLMEKANVDILFNSEVEDVKIEKSNVKSIKINSETLSVYIDTTYVVDATGNCEFSKKINCNFINNSEEIQPCNLRFIMSGVNLEKFSNWIMELDPDRNVTSSAYIDGQIHLSTAYTWDTNVKWALKPIFEKAISDGVINSNDSNYFQLFTIPGMPFSVAFNCPRIVLDNPINVLNPMDTSKALIYGRKSIYRLAEFCKKYLVGFENAYISSIANSLGVRVSRRIKGKYIYRYNDMNTGKEFENPCLVSDYPVDIHANKKDNSILEKQEKYMLPIESLISDDYDNLFVVGRCLSADFKAQAALRIIPSCFSMGEGIAKYIADLENNKNM